VATSVARLPPLPHEERSKRLQRLRLAPELFYLLFDLIDVKTSTNQNSPFIDGGLPRSIHAREMSHHLEMLHRVAVTLQPSDVRPYKISAIGRLVKFDANDVLSFCVLFGFDKQVSRRRKFKSFHRAIIAPSRSMIQDRTGGIADERSENHCSTCGQTGREDD